MQEDLQKHYSHIRYVLILVLVCNWAVALVKIVYGLWSRCASMTADGFHSLSDGTSNIIGLIGIHLSAHPRDEDHPYGHKKYETLFSLGIAAILFFVAFNLIKEGIGRFCSHVVPEVTTTSFVVMLITLGINVWVMLYEYGKGKRLKSDILVADAMHTKADIFTTISVLAALVAIELGYPILDPIVTVLIAVFVAHAGYDILRDCSGVLCDGAAIKDVQKIEEVARSIPGVQSCHKIRTRGRPDDISVDLHCQVDPTVTMRDAHAISHSVGEALKREIPGVTEVFVHMEPLQKG